MRASALFLSISFLLAGCGDDDRSGDPTDAGGGTDAIVLPDTGGGTDAGTPMAVCTEPTDVICVDESILELNLFTDPNLAEIENTPDGDGFTTHVDATGGGFMPSLGYVYARFTDTGLVRVDLGDEEAFDSMEWDIAFRRFVIRLNSGVSGPSCVGGARTGPSTEYDTFTGPLDTLEYRTEEYFTPTCEIVPDGSGLGSPGTALQSFWEYPGCVQMTGNVYVLRLASGRRLKLTVTSYYEPTVQAMCDTEGMIDMGAPSGAGNMRLRWQFLDP